MPHKDPAARAKYWADFYANPENQKKNRAKVKRWRKRNPAKFRAQARRSRKAARDREALSELAEAKAITEQARIAAIEIHRAQVLQQKHQGYGGKINVARI